MQTREEKVIATMRTFGRPCTPYEVALVTKGCGQEIARKTMDGLVERGLATSRPDGLTTAYRLT